MKRVALVFLAVFFLCTSAIAGDGPKAGGELKNLTLNDPLPADQAAYLGVSGKGPFQLSDIKGKTLLIEVYTLYCPFCQAEADKVNALYEMLKTSPEGKNVKVIGIGVGNSAYEVDAFRKKFSVPFPLFSDKDFVTYQEIGDVGTPFFILARLDKKGGPLKILHVNEGQMDSLEGFFQESINK